MSLEDLYLILKSTELPVAYSHFNEIISPPYITYLSVYSSNFNADNKVYKKIYNIQIELYTKHKDLEIEKKLEDLLDENEIVYETTEEWIDSEKVFQRVYEVRLI